MIKAAITTLFILSLCTPYLHTSAEPSPRQLAQLRTQLQKICATAPSGALVGCAVSNASNGEMLFTYNGSVNRRLASITKILVSAAALCELGPDYQFTTSLYSIGPIRNKTVAGLGIVGRGDPCLDEHFSNKNPDSFFISWAKKIRAQGIRHISGPIYIDNSFFSGPAKPLTYPQDHSNQQKWYSAPASAFAWNDNCIEARAVPQKSGTCLIEYRPHAPQITIRNKSKSVINGGKASRYFIISRAHKSNTLTISGAYKKTTSWFPLAIHQDPDLLIGEHFRYILQQQGITVSGKVIIKRFRLDNSTLIHQEQHTLLPALRILNQRSQNFYGEQILRILGQRHRKIGSIEHGRAAVVHYLTSQLHVSDPQLRILDGSGLSYNNSASPTTLCRVLNAMHRHPQGKNFHSTLRTARYSWAQKYPSKVKTGSLAVARCLSGYFDSKSGTRYSFSILLNKGNAKSIYWANSLREKLYKAMLTSVGQL